jgi:hypothetical protein
MPPNVCFTNYSRNNSVGIATGHRLKDKEIGVEFLAKARDFLPFTASVLSL